MIPRAPFGLGHIVDVTVEVEEESVDYDDELAEDEEYVACDCAVCLDGEDIDDEDYVECDCDCGCGNEVEFGDSDVCLSCEALCE